MQTHSQSDDIVLIYAPAFCLPLEYLTPPLGLLYVGASLRAAGFGVRLFDFQDRTTRWEDVAQCLAATASPLVGFSCDSDNIYRALRISDRILARHPRAHVVFGGPHVTYAGDPYVCDRRFVIRGEGELPMVRLARYLLQGQGTLEDVPGLVYRGGGVTRRNQERPVPAGELDALPFPDYSLLSTPRRYQPVMTTSRGCPYRCHFCSEGNSQRAYRPRGIPNIRQELLHLKEVFGGRLLNLAFGDDTFTSSARRVLELCDVFDEVFPDKTKFSFFCEGRVNVLARRPDLIRRLREAGMMRMQIGVEAGDQATLDRLNKQIRLEDIETVVRACVEAGVPALNGAFICGLPGQTEADVLNEIEYAKHLIDIGQGHMETSMVALSALPGTEFRQNAGKWGLRILDGEFASGGLLEGCFSETATLSKADITRLCRQFNWELERYSLETSSWFPPRRLKQQFVFAADCVMQPWLVRKFICFHYLQALLDLRRRADHRFLFELPGDEVLDAAPLRLRQNTLAHKNDGWEVNPGTPFAYEMSLPEYGFYEYFNGKLTFREIGRRLAAQHGKAPEWGIEECLHVYGKCEDKLSSITVF